ncbi:MAG: hypothetical protein IJ068_06775 [Bacilli bacterium]|nr:hypothetical protein [Bacilli bacterium]
MDYKEYHKTYYNFKRAKNKLHKIEDELADVINALLSVTSQIKDIVSFGGFNSDKMLSLTTRKDELEQQEILARDLLKVREKQNIDAEKELRKSKESKDIIYYRYFIDHIKVKDISKEIPLAREYTYELLKQIKVDITNIEQEIREKYKKK